MKRSVAIVGSTPMFVRWAIEHPCPLREIFPQRLPETTFRQLRGIREISLAAIEQRIHESVCLHPTASADKPDTALGFPVDEIVDVFGGIEFVDSCCQSCPANALAGVQPKLLAGCYGWLSTDLRIDFSAITRGVESATTQVEEIAKIPAEFDLVGLLDAAVERLSLAEEMGATFVEASPWWFGLWRESPITETQLRLLQGLLKKVNETIPAAIHRDDLDGFRNAVAVCQQHHLPLHVDLVPAGFSDGRHWTIARHCGICKRKCDPSETVCPACGTAGHQQNPTKFKVLGLRPYMNLAGIFGNPATEQFLRRNL